MTLNLHLLRIYTAVVEHNNFSRAADALYMSQPAVSKAVRELERQIGLDLLDRSHRRLALTEAGRVLHLHAQRLFAVEQAAEAALEQLQGLERGQLALGASQTIGTYLLPPLLGQFHQQYPGIRLSLEIANTQAVLEALHMQELDFAVVEGPVNHEEFSVTRWRNDRLVVILPPDHHLIGQHSVTLEQLAAEPYVQRESGSGTRMIVERVFQNRGLELNIAIELSSNQAVKQAVSAGLGISIVSIATIALEAATNSLAIIEVSESGFMRSLSQVMLREKPVSPAAAAFSQLLHTMQ